MADPRLPFNTPPALLGAAFFLALAALLAEVVGFRLCAATFGADLALLLALSSPAVGGLGATLLASRSADRPPARVAVSAARMATAAGVMVILLVVTVTWATQRAARLQGETDWLQIGVIGGSWLLLGLSSGGAFGLVMRRGAAAPGRLCFAAGVGGAFGCLLVPAAMWVGAPRAGVMLGAVFGLASLLLTRVGRAAKPNYGLAATLPLAALVLVAGDLGSPWLKLRTDMGSRFSMGENDWTAQGMLAVERIRRNRAKVVVDRGAVLELSLKSKSNRKPLGGVSELSYVLSERSVGRALIVGSGAGREIRMALAHGHGQVDAIELSRALTGELLGRRYGREMGNLLSDPAHVKLSFGDGRHRHLAGPPGYQRIIVISEPELVQVAPRLLMASDRRLTVQAIAAYLAQLTPGSGNLVLRVPKNQLPALMATAEQALGLARQEARKRMLACSERKGAAALLIAPKPLAPRDLRRLRRYCRRKRLSVEYPMLEIRESDTELESKTKKQDEQLALLNAAVAVDDSKPFLEDPPAFSALAAAGLKELRGLRHVPEAKQRKRLAPKRQGAAPADKPASPSPTARRAAVAAMAVLIALGLALLALLLPPSKAPEAHNPTFTFRGATLLFGVAASLGMFAASELMLQLLGDRAYGWQLVLPLGLVGLAGGRLWVDSVPKGRIRSYLIVTVALGVPALIGAHVALPALVASALTSSAGGALALLAVGAAGLLMGWLLGAPLAAAMRLSGRQNPVAVASIWGLHLAGWALGGALAALSVYYLGSAKLLTLAAAALGVGGLLLAASGPPSAPKKVPATLGPTPS